MGLATPEIFRLVCPVSNDVPGERLQFYLSQGARRLRQWVGDAYKTAELVDLASDPPPSQDEVDLKEALTLAEMHLAFHYGVRNFNTQLRPQGIVLQAKADGNTVLTFLSPAQVDQAERGWLDSAHEIAMPYLLANGTPSAPLMVTE